MAVDLTYLKRFDALEKELIKKYGTPRGPLIAIGGWAGTGKDTAAKNLRKLLRKRNGMNLPFKVTGRIMRAEARKAGFDEGEMGKFVKYLSKKGEDMDIYADKKTMQTALKNGCGIYVGRIAPWSCTT